MYLKDRAGRDGKCYPAIGAIAAKLKLSRSTVKSAIADLEKSGFLRKERRWRENCGKTSHQLYVLHPAAGLRLNVLEITLPAKGRMRPLHELWNGSL